MEEPRLQDIARMAAELVVMIDALPLPDDPRDKAIFHKATKRARRILREITAAERMAKPVQRTDWLRCLEAIGRLLATIARIALPG